MIRTYQNKKNKNKLIEYNYLRLKRVSYLHIIEEYRMRDQIICGGDHTCLMYSRGKVRLFGRNQDGQLNAPAIG